MMFLFWDPQLKENWFLSEYEWTALNQMKITVCDSEKSKKVVFP